MKCLTFATFLYFVLSKLLSISIISIFSIFNSLIICISLTIPFTMFAESRRTDEECGIFDPVTEHSRLAKCNSSRGAVCQYRRGTDNNYCASTNVIFFCFCVLMDCSILYYICPSLQRSWVFSVYQRHPSSGGWTRISSINLWVSLLSFEVVIR